MIHVFIGTKAQYIKTAPLIWAMEEQGIDYRLIDSGQHAELAGSFQVELGLRAPDVRLGGGTDITTIPQAARWGLGLAARMVSRRRLIDQVFGGAGGVCVVHGDTPSTLLSMMMARRAGLAVAHLEAGLRSGRWLHPFPEEMIRHLVARRADLLFAPDGDAESNLAAMKVKGKVVALPANTIVEVLSRATPGEVGGGPVIVTMHRVENLHRRRRREDLATLVERLAGERSVRWMLHEPTSGALGRSRMDRLERAGAELRALAGHREFVEMLAAAPFVITDGGSIQEECALLGVPTLLWRKHTERPDGVGANVVVSRYEPAVIEAFLEDPARHRRPPRIPEVSPGARALEALAGWR
jgi:UDP-N-acetylglucosamine 2-epimerase